MSRLTRRELGIGLAGAAAARAARAQPGRNVMVGGFDVGPGGFPNNFNPLSATAGFQWFNLYYETLLEYDVGLRTIGAGLAQSYDVSSDGKSMTFHLVPDAKWHDGERFTSADVRFTFELAKDPRVGSVFAGRLADVQGVDTPDAETAVLRLARPNGSLPDMLTKMMVLPEHALGKLPREGLDRNAWWRTSPVGTGPFSFVQYATDQYVELKANPAYRRGRPKLDGLINRYFKNTAGAVAAQRSGEIQFTYVEPDDEKSFEGDTKNRIIKGDSWVINFLGFNHKLPIWSDLRVRQAVMHAINRDAIIKSIMGGAATVANCVYVDPKVVPNDLNPYAYDPAKAKELLAAAGWDRINGSKNLSLLTYYNNPLNANLLAAIQAMLAQVGIMVTPRLLDVPTYVSIMTAKEPDYAQFPLIYAGAQMGPDLGAVSISMMSDQVPPRGNNTLRIAMPELDAAFAAGITETDPAKRLAKFQDVARVQNRLLPWATMWITQRFGVVSTDIENFLWTPAPGGGGYEQYAERWAFRKA
jgi:peptide/nickel transport system substrate-binding protein